MGHRSNLYLQSPKRAIPLFEANNSLPFFWLALLDTQTLKEKFKDWEEAMAREELAEEEDQEEEWNAEWPSTNIILSKQLFLENADRSHAFLKTHFPDCLPLFTHFVSGISGNWEAEDRLEMDIIQYAGFYELFRAFCEALQGEIAAIENNSPGEIYFLMTTDLIAGGTGFATSENSEFAALEVYKEALEDRGKQNSRPEQIFNPKALIVAVLTLLLCPGFTYGLYKKYSESGISGMLAVFALLNLIFYFFSLGTIVAEIKAARKDKG